MNSSYDKTLLDYDNGVLLQIWHDLTCEQIKPDARPFEIRLLNAFRQGSKNVTYRPADRDLSDKIAEILEEMRTQPPKLKQKSRFSQMLQGKYDSFVTAASRKVMLGPHLEQHADKYQREMYERHAHQYFQWLSVAGAEYFTIGLAEYARLMGRNYM